MYVLLYAQNMKMKGRLDIVLLPLAKGNTRVKHRIHVVQVRETRKAFLRVYAFTKNHWFYYVVVVVVHQKANVKFVFQTPCIACSSIRADLKKKLLQELNTLCEQYTRILLYSPPTTSVLVINFKLQTWTVSLSLFAAFIDIYGQFYTRDAVPKHFPQNDEMTQLLRVFSFPCRYYSPSVIFVFRSCHFAFEIEQFSRFF